MSKAVQQPNLEDIRGQVDIVNNWITLADSKATFLLTATTFFLSASLLALHNFRDAIVNDLATQHYIRGIVAICLLVAYFSCTLMCLFFLIKVIKPRLKRIIKKEDYSLIYFMDVAETSLSDFRLKMQSCSSRELREQLVDQIYANSVVAKRKYQDLNQAIIFLALLILSALCLIIITIR